MTAVAIGASAPAPAPAALPSRKRLRTRSRATSGATSRHGHGTRGVFHRSAQSTTSFWGHLAMLFGALWRALFRARAKASPLPPRRHSDFFPWPGSFRGDLRRRGVAVARIPEALVAALEDLARQTLTLAAEASARAAGAAEGEGTGTEPSEPSPSFLRAGSLNRAFPDTMSWHWAQNHQGLEAFASAARIAPRTHFNASHRSSSHAV